ILEKAMHLCSVEFGSLQTYDGEMFCAMANRGLPPAFAERLSQGYRPGPAHPLSRLFSGEAFVQVPDLAASDTPQGAFEIGGMRTLLSVPLLREGAVVGIINLARNRVESFSDKQIALIQNFAAQAVIAMENARLITETRERTRDLQESLEYQTATSDVLKVISQSDADLSTVLQTVLDTAASLCEADAGNIFLRRREQLELMASIGASPQASADLAAHPILVDRRTTSGRAVLTGQVTHVADITADPEYTHASTMASGIRTMLGVPLLREDNPIGSLSLARYTVKPFTHKQIELVRTFADQAVIAIENARLLGELRSRTDELARSVDELKA